LDKKSLLNLNSKNNLNLQILKEAKKIHISFRNIDLESSLNLICEGTEIRSLLNKKLCQSFCQGKNLHIYRVEQLIERKGDRLLTWKQVMKIRGYKDTGKKPSWYKEIEKLVLKDISQRMLLENWQTLGANSEAIVSNLNYISNNSRKRE